MTSKGEQRRKEEQAYLEWVRECVSRQLVGAAQSADFANDLGTYRVLQRGADRARDELSHIDQPFYARLDFLEPDDVLPETVYIGKARVRGESASVDAVVDWRSPLGELYNQANHHEPMGVGRRVAIKNANWLVSKVTDDVLVMGFVAPGASHIEIPLPPGVDPEQWKIDLTGAVPSVSALGPEEAEPARIDSIADFETDVDLTPLVPELVEVDDGDEVGLDADVLAELDEAGQTIRGGDSLFDELVRDRTGRMEEVVATIQSDQDRILRSDPFRALAIQGGPGTGKTVIALHRAAFVIYK
ncbi:MAG: hypothetical protein GX868_14650, partial [Actinobacteria bacterium]|nr:hypothetical protein [Actinomycetota bacterium]